jgi:hypothetical protein
MKTIVFTLIAIGSALATSSEGAEGELAQAPTDPASGHTATFATQPAGIWQGEVGEGFRPGVQTLSVEAGGAGGFAAFGGRQAHDFALTSVSYGYMLGKVVGEGHWYRGNWEIRGEFFGGLQVSPSRDWLVGLTPHLRYNFATGTRWIPFADLGAGVSATDIGRQTRAALSSSTSRRIPACIGSCVIISLSPWRLDTCTFPALVSTRQI